MSTRRGLLALFTGVTSAAGAGVRPRDLLAMASTLKVPAPDFSVPNAPIEECKPSALQKLLKKHRRILSDELDAKEMTCFPSNMPVHIATKRSWSATFKQSEWCKEEIARRNARNAIWDDDALIQVLERAGIL